MTNDPFIVYSSNIFAILGLRALFFLLANMLDRFVYLKAGVALILIFVGIKMTISGWVHLPILLSLGVIVATLAGKPVGFAQLYPMYSSVRTARTWILNDLYVDDAARRSGVARTLLEAAAAFAREDGAAGISLETTQDNAAARALYRAAGWNEDATQWYSLSFSKQHH